MLKRIQVAMLPVEAARMGADCYIVVDALRATTTLATLFANGVREVWAVNDLEQARHTARQNNALLLGEVGGLPPEGFDLGNSPVEIATAGLQRDRAVLFTTNGTAALCAMAAHGDVVAGALTNTSAVASAAGAPYEHVAVVCAGNDGGQGFALEDFAVAGALVERLTALAPTASLDDGAQLALRAISGPGVIAALISQATHAESLRNLGLDADIAFASIADTTACVPFVADHGDGWARIIDGAGH